MLWLTSCFAALAVTSMDAPRSFEILDVERHAVYAGRLGHRINREVLVLKDGARTVRVTIRGAYHTVTMPKGQVFRAGQHVALAQLPAKNGVDRRDVLILR